MRSLVFLSCLILLTTKCLAQAPFTKNGKQGFLAADGTVLLPAIYDTAFVATDLFDPYKYLLFGNKIPFEGKRSILYQCNMVFDYHVKRSFQTKGWEIGLLDRDKDYQVPNAKYVRIDIFKEYVACAYLANGMVDVYNKGSRKPSKKRVASLASIEALNCDRGFIYKKKKYYGLESNSAFFSKKRRLQLLPPIYDLILPIYTGDSCNRDPLYGYKVKRKGKWGYVNDAYQEKDWGYDTIIIRHLESNSSIKSFFLLSKKGTEEKLHYLGDNYLQEKGSVNLKDLGIEFDAIEAFDLVLEGYSYESIRIKVNGKWGVLHFSCFVSSSAEKPANCLSVKWLVEPKYDEINYLFENTWAVRNGTYWGSVAHPEEKKILPIIYDSIELFSVNSRYLLVKKKDKYGLTKEGTTLLEPRYDTIQDCFVVEEGLWGVFDGEDSLLLKPQYDSIYYLKDKGNLAIAYLKGNVYSLDLTTFETKKISALDRLFSFSFKEQILIDPTTIGIAHQMAEYPFMFLPYLDQRKDTLRIEGFYLSLAGTYLRQWNEGAETYWERKIDEDFSQARYWVDVNQDGRREIVISFAHFWDRNGYKVRRTWKVLDGKTGRLVWEYVHHNSTNNRIKFCDLNKDGIPDFIFDNNNLIEVVDGQKGTILLTNYWGLKGTLYVIDTNETSLPTIYCLGNVLTSYETKEAQIYTRHTHNHTTSAPFVTAGEGTALVANANHYGPPYINPFYYLFKLPKNYLPNPKTNRMELESPLKINLPGYYRSSFFMHDNGQVLIGIVTSMGVIGLYNQEAQLVGLYQGPKGMISLKLQEENGTQEIIIKTNKNEIYHYNKKIDIELWQGISY